MLNEYKKTLGTMRAAIACIVVLSGVGCQNKGQVIPQVIAWAPPHAVALAVRNDRAAEISLVDAQGGVQRIAPGASATLPLFVYKVVPSNEFATTQEFLGLVPESGTGRLTVGGDGAKYITESGNGWAITVRITADEEWIVNLKPGDCLFNGVNPVVPIGNDRSPRAIDLCIPARMW